MAIKLTKIQTIVGLIIAIPATLAVINEYRFWASASEASYLADLTCPRARLEIEGRIDYAEQQINQAKRAKNWQRVLDKKEALHIWEEEKAEIIRKCKHFKK